MKLRVSFLAFKNLIQFKSNSINVDNEKIMTTSSIFNRLPGAGVGTNKRRSALIFNRMIRHYQHDYNFVPMTFVLPEHKEKLK